MSRVFRNKGSWWIDFKDAAGARRRKKIPGADKRLAREVLNSYLGKVARQEHLGVLDDSPISFADFAKEWRRRVTPTLKPGTQERWFGILEKHLKPAFPGALRAITQADVESYIARRLEEATVDKVRVIGGRESNRRRMRRARPATVNRELAVIKHMMRRAVDWRYVAENRVAKIKPLKEAPGRTRFLSLEEIGRLLEACDAEALISPLARVYLKPFVLLALNSGMRRNEILGLTRRAIDWQNRMVTLEATKNGDIRHVYLNDTAAEALRSLPARIDTDRLFPFKPSQVSMAFRRAVKRAKIADFRLHDARHTFASYQAMAGVQGRGLQELLGHKDGRMTMRYSHLADTYLRAAVNKVNLGGADATAAALSGATSDADLAPGSA